MQKTRGAFTLIELLIVVAIIAILAMIAIPNFLEAQTRAKVSRARSDLRSLAVAVEAYHVDDNNWPFMPQVPGNHEWDIIRAHGWPQEYGMWFILTTPIPYITTIPRDTFWRFYNEQWNIWQDYYRVWNLTNNGPGDWGGPSTYYLRKNSVHVLMASVGPDKVEDIANGDAGRPMPGSQGMTIYDPTNGTVSWGDIYYGLPGVGFDLYHKYAW